MGPEELEKSKAELLENVRLTLAPYLKKLDLKWPIKYDFDETVLGPHISTSPDRKEHEILFSLKFAEKIKEWKFDFVHELCHAHLAEKIDPVFGSAYFSKKMDLENEKFLKAYYHYFGLAYKHIDLWVNDKLSEIEPDLAKADVESFIEISKKILENPDYFEKYLLDVGGKNVQFGLRFVALGYGLNMAQAERMGLAEKYKKDHQEILAKTEEYCGKDFTLMTEKLTQYLKDLPKLPEERKEALKLLEDSTQKVAEIFNFPLEISLVEEEGKAVWLVEEKK